MSNAVALSPDGSRLYSGSIDNTVIVWDVRSGERLHTLKGHTEWCHGSRLYSGSGDNTVIVWDARTGERLHTLKGHTNMSGGGAVARRQPALLGVGRQHRHRLGRPHRRAPAHAQGAHG